jgi:hypothetical protein
MSPKRLRQIEELYHATREGTREQRAALLAQADPDLRREVESLLMQPTGDEFPFTSTRARSCRNGERD